MATLTQTAFDLNNEDLPLFSWTPIVVTITARDPEPDADQPSLFDLETLEESSQAEKENAS